MSRLQLARQGYTTLANVIAVALNEQTSDSAEAWLENEVCPVYPELVRNRSFRMAVRWSCDHFSRGANVEERRLVEAVDEALVGCARELAAVTTADTGETSADRPDVTCGIAISPSDRITIDLIAGRPWLDLVCCEDFFHPTCELCLRNPNSNHTTAFRSRGELRLPLGDYVARYMFARIEYWKSVLEPIWNDVFFRRVSSDSLPQETRNRLFNVKITLDAAVDRLRTASCSGHRTQQRESCMVLTQVYAAYAQRPNLEWLGIRPRAREMIRSCVRRRVEMATVQAGGVGLPEIVHRRPASLCDPAVLRQIAAALHDVTAFYEIPEDADDRIAWACDRARLVMVDQSARAVFWDGKEIIAGQWDQQTQEWNLLWVLGSNPGRTIDQMMLANREHHPMKSRRYRLSLMLENDAPELDGLIENVRRQGYRLELTAEEVILLRDAGAGRLAIVDTLIANA